MFIYSTQERLHPTFSVHNIILIPPFLSLNISHYKTTHGVISTNPQKTIFTRKSSLLVVNVRHIIQCTCPPIMTEILNSPKNNLNQLTDGGCKKWRNGMKPHYHQVLHRSAQYFYSHSLTLPVFCFQLYANHTAFGTSKTAPLGTSSK